VARLPVLSGQQLVAALKKGGFKVVRRKGSHISLQKGAFRTVVPLHEELARGTLLSILKQCGLSREELNALLK
jgi:predicted RNA binding protein YcfA (HicA-like mRNA interferase family)